MVHNGKEFFVQRNLAANTFEMYGRDYVGKFVYSMTDVVMSKVEEGAMFNPLLKLTQDEATMLMTELWNAGVRPNNGEGNPGHVGALKAHLEDMRKIAFSYIDLQK